MLSARAARAELPPLPPEYLRHEEAGLRFAYHPSVRDRVRPLLDQVGPIREELRSRIGRPVLPTVEIRVAVGADDLERVAPSEGVRAQDVIVDSSSHVLAFRIPEDASHAHVASALGRGLAELALDEAPAVVAPRWFRAGFIGGFAEASALERRWRLWWATMNGRLLPLSEIDARVAPNAAFDELADLQAIDLVRMLASRPEAFRSLLAAATDRVAFEGAIVRDYRTDVESLERQWRGELERVRLASGMGGLALVLCGVLAFVTLRRRARRARMVANVPSVLVVDADSVGRTVRPALPPPHEAAPPKVSHDGRWHTLH